MTQLAHRPVVDASSPQRGRGAPWAALLIGILIGGGAMFGVLEFLGGSTDDGPTESELLVDDWMAAIEAQDLEALIPLYSEEALWYDQALGDEFTGHLGVRRGWGIFGLRDFEVLDLEAVSIDDDGAVIRWTLAGSSSPFNGQPWESTGVSVLTITDGLVVEETVYYDSRDVQ